ncbi:DNA cytosine methyltransferase [Methanobrevibacter filiformis]|uniref:DNA (cytosine-5-)-methyltransferase n=1 Tax=Methanobrevibacter filiformis TaxID=55758 RepID=A0A166ESV9_9EURY|nr:DNA cytosine methyltransferase [Methanobrevibacter filiformis]KZX16974.1 modification methylase HaeIII [Methanobrevibacter filiformis]
MKVASFFSGAGGLDLGFSNAGYEFVFANDNWKGCWETFERNHGLKINRKSIEHIKPHEIPDVVGFVGGPPCQSWSLAGAMKGIKDPRGEMLYHYLRLIKAKKPLFFLAENVPGLVCKTHFDEFTKFINALKGIGYNLSYQVLNASDYGVPQDRKRVFIVGFSEKIDSDFIFPKPQSEKINLKEAIGDLREPLPAKDKNKANHPKDLEIPNHEYMTGDFSSMYMSRNRVRKWNEPSFTIQAGGRHAPCHPQASPMVKIEKDKRIFDPNSPKPYRRLSVRECARIQTFPDDFIFYYNNIGDGYKMIGNAVPVKLSEAIATKILDYI